MSGKSPFGGLMNNEEQLTSMTPDQVAAFMQLLRDKLVDSGMDGNEFDMAVAAAVQAVLTPPSEDDIFTRKKDQLIENRGIDSLGRILVEYCFMRSHDDPMIWPDNSEQDQKARKIFTREYMPRPLMRYFLASVRGSNPQLDGFTAESILSDGGTNSKEAVEALLEEFKGPFGDGESAIQWEDAYEDLRFKQFALELIHAIRLEFDNLGTERYLGMLEDFRQRDMDRDGINAMDRNLVSDDVRQIKESLDAAENMLSKATH